MAKLEDAEIKLNIAEESFKKREYASCIRNSQLCIEIALKSLLDEIGISYERKEKDKQIFLHDVSPLLKEVFEKVQQFYETDYRRDDLRIKLARAGVILKCLTSIKDICEFGYRDLKTSAKEIFGFYFEEFAKNVKEIASQTYWLVFDIFQKLKKY